MRSLVVACVLVACLGCGAPKAGDSCDKAGFLCADAQTALECKLGKWAALPCRGSGGCKQEKQTIQCDMSENLEGDACASVAERAGLCTAAGDAALICQNGTLSKTSCKTCIVADKIVTCQP